MPGMDAYRGNRLKLFASRLGEEPKGGRGRKPAPKQSKLGITVLVLTPGNGLTDSNVSASRLEFRKDLLAWAESLPDYGSELQRKLGELYPDESEFQKTSMMELKRIAAEAGY
jgi:hypothetical protein